MICILYLVQLKTFYHPLHCDILHRKDCCNCSDNFNPSPQVTEKLAKLKLDCSSRKFKIRQCSQILKLSVQDPTMKIPNSYWLVRLLGDWVLDCNLYGRGMLHILWSTISNSRTSCGRDPGPILDVVCLSAR